MCPDLRLFGGVEEKFASDATVGSGMVESRNEPAKNQPGGSRATNDGGNLTARTVSETNGSAAAGSGAFGSTDTSLVQLAQSALARNPSVPGGKVRCVVRNAWLIMEGEVEARIDKQAAEEAVRGLPGIHGISNNILIESEVMAQGVGRKIDEVFVRNARLSANRISVTASNHKVILCGSVHSGVEREAAGAAAWGVPGVADVVNRLRVTGGEG